MTTQLLITLPDKTYKHITQYADFMGQSINEIMLQSVEDFTDFSMPEVDYAALYKHDLLALTNIQLTEQQDTRLSELLYMQQDNALNSADRIELRQLMQLYNSCLIKKAYAMAEAVKRGLMPPLST